ncbi:hypothetical protein BUALT_Bualt03G0100700 [Buddleja alternifolia]|uniref:25S rRNA (uridine-N(3))-methyltransferase BMT5-like domain-containing protein n=1 Tax=Buddleja alternifolia TaxID=168488 RepID=A0AAV6Y0N1_9LAMI|nr:hypothetical protein BUALT_Bualt03G0100700 [Buddleja alternifolia]
MKWPPPIIAGDREDLTYVWKYKNASANVAMLGMLGASLLLEVDATQMKNHPALSTMRFHRIIYNFPHAGFSGKEDDPDVITRHRNLVRGFFMNASSLLWPDGEIHVNHKITAPFSDWKIEDLATECSLILTEQVNFRIEHYPGYNNKRGSGFRCDEPFPLGRYCSTFKFKLCRTTTTTTNILDMMRNLYLNTTTTTSQNLQIPVVMQQQPTVPVPVPDPDPVPIDHSFNECLWIFGWYLNHVEETFGAISYDIDSSLREALRVGFETYMSAVPGRPESGYIDILEQLHHLSIVRSQRLRHMLLLLVDQQL